MRDGREALSALTEMSPGDRGESPCLFPQRIPAKLDFFNVKQLFYLNTIIRGRGTNMTSTRRSFPTSLTWVAFMYEGIEYVTY